MLLNLIRGTSIKVCLHGNTSQIGHLVSVWNIKVTCMFMTFGFWSVFPKLHILHGFDIWIHSLLIVFSLGIHTFFNLELYLFTENESSQCNQFLMRFIFVSSLHFFTENSTLYFKRVLCKKTIVKCKSLRLLKMSWTNKTEKLIIDYFIMFSFSSKYNYILIFYQNGITELFN